MGRRKESGQAGQVSISSWEAGKADSHLGGEDQERRSTTYHGRREGERGPHGDIQYLLDVPLGTEGEYAESRLSVRSRADATLNLGLKLNGREQTPYF